GQLDDRRLGPPLAGDLLVRLGDVNELKHPGQAREAPPVHLAIVADDPDRGALLPRDRPGIVAHLFDRIDNAPNILFGRVMTHDDQHRSCFLSCSESSAALCAGSLPGGSTMRRASGPSPYSTERSAERPVERALPALYPR